MAMGKKRNGEGSAAPKERAPAAQIERKDDEGDGAQRLAVSASNGGIGMPPAPAKVHVVPRNHCELALAIFAECDPAALGCEVLEKSDDRGAATKLRALETFADWAYGKPATGGTSGRVRIIWDIPLPAHKAINPDPETVEGGEK
jgi:hypothetical protein